MAFIIGISGGSASGKSTFIAKLKNYFGDSHLSILSQDHYYKPLYLQVKNKNGEINFDEPESLNLDKFITDVEILEAGNELAIEEYHFNNPNKQPNTITIKPTSIILVEGLFIMSDSSIFNKLNLKIFIDADEDIKYNRRLRRDSEERGMEADEIKYQWHNQVLPSYDKYILPYKEKADILIINNVDFEEGLNLVIERIQKLLIPNL